MTTSQTPRALGFPWQEPSSAQAPAETLDAHAIWASLRAGRERVAASFCTETECHVELEPGIPGQALGMQYWAVLDLFLQGESQKVIAFEHRVAPSTIAVRIRRSLEWLGVHCGQAEVSAAVINISQVARGALPYLLGRVRSIPGKLENRLISIPRPDPRLLGVLSPAEIKVVQLLVEGKTRHRMAELRGTSERTLANQLGQVHKKLNVTGRIPLLIRLMQANTHVEIQTEMLSS